MSRGHDHRWVYMYTPGIETYHRCNLHACQYLIFEYHHLVTVYGHPPLDQISASNRAECHARYLILWEEERLPLSNIFGDMYLYLSIY